MSENLPVLDPHPALRASNVELYVNARLDAGTINLYSAYVLVHEALRLRRRCYLQPAWGKHLSIRGLLDIYYDYLTGTALQTTGEAHEAADWFVSDLPLLKERRPHFLADRLAAGRSLLEDRGFYELLSTLRREYDHLSDDDGPFPLEVFPYHFAAPERELLQRGSEALFQQGQELDPDSSELYVQLQINA